MKGNGQFNVLAAFSVRIRLEKGKICKNNYHTCLFYCINTCWVPWMTFNTWPIGLVSKQHPRDPANVMHVRNKNSNIQGRSPHVVSDFSYHKELLLNERIRSQS